MNFLRVIILLLLTASCGKGVKKRNSSDPVTTAPPSEEYVDLDAQAFLTSLKLECDDCSSSVGVMVFKKGDELRHCPAALIDRNRVLSRLDCVGRDLWFENISCQNYVVGLFSKNEASGTRAVLCDRVIFKGDIKNQHALLQAENVIIFRLKESLNQSHADIGTYGVWSNSYQKFFHFTSSNTKGKTFKIRKKSCEPLFNSYANPFAISEQSPVVSFKNCGVQAGESYGLVFNSFDEVVSVTSGRLSRQVKEHIQELGYNENPMEDIFHGMNLHCLSWQELTHERGEECGRARTFSTLYVARGRMLESQSIHQENMERVFKELHGLSRYFFWSYQFHYTQAKKILELGMKRPNCMQDPESWIGDFRTRRGRIRKSTTIHWEVPDYKLKLRLHSDYTPYSKLIVSGKKKFRISFSPYNAFYFDKTDLRIRYQVDEENRSFDFDQLTSCL